jgi:hypothetical protein
MVIPQSHTSEVDGLKMVSFSRLSFPSNTCGTASANIHLSQAMPECVMTTKDYVYLGLILITSLVFYCNGFYAGVCRSKRLHENIVDGAEPEGKIGVDAWSNDKTFVLCGKELASEMAPRRNIAAPSQAEAESNFGLN